MQLREGENNVWNIVRAIRGRIIAGYEIIPDMVMCTLPLNPGIQWKSINGTKDEYCGYRVMHGDYRFEMEEGIWKYFDKFVKEICWKVCVKVIAYWNCIKGEVKFCHQENVF